MILLQMLFQWGSATTRRALWYAWLQEEAQGGDAFRTLQTKSLAQNRRRKVLFSHAVFMLEKKALSAFFFFFFFKLTFTVILRKTTVQQQARAGCGSCKADE